ncbi:acyl transferase domain-containing protein [Hirsutella rhossiliensis]|uniref:Acyl transferase domain-containing protein n=1 Tax=Hirsutella rhossiliensis TaxID=111463 RepID=A0A9P8MXA8_9HYPO|nr:acyl transferase domain-containing protein [Hirsutella rhossiliensis]KAH0963793.1 acyl transferase domain-containing protein [Hirsutella rhossiliensis]
MYAGASRPSTKSETASLAEQTAKAYAVFGGQGNTTDYFGELRTLFRTYTRFVEPLFITAEQALHNLLADTSATRRRQFHQGLAILTWLRRPETTPELSYLLSAPVSFPLIGLIQFSNYAVVCRCREKSPGEAAHQLLGMAGHSQGIVVAAALATVTTWKSFDTALVKALTVLFHVGSAAQEATPHVSVPPVISKEAMCNGEGYPSSMLNVVGCRLDMLKEYMNEVNKNLQMHQRVFIGLINGQTNYVVSGPVLSLCALASMLRRVKAASDADQSNIAFSSRKPEFSQRFLPVEAPFHTAHLKDAATRALGELCTLHLAASELMLPVYHSRHGGDLRSSGARDVVPALVRMILCELDDWTLSTAFGDATHVLDFGPGGLSGVGPLLYRNKEGSGVRVILAGLEEGGSVEFGYRAEAFASKATFDETWAQKYSPSLVQSTMGTIKMDNRMAQLLGFPPVMVAGMTPTTAAWEFVSVIMNSGYHVELAAGGLHSVEQLTSAITSLVQATPVGRGVCVNVIYANPRQVRWQIPLLQRLRSQGVPIDGLTFGAGVPSIDVAKEYMELGFRYLSFKPGSSYPILMQWTGGRGGGHHSYEDFHEPILKLYGRIRRCPNIVLLAGSGFGGAKDSYPYLSGTWSAPFGRPRMPFDGILLGSRVMVAKEAKTSRGCKEAIVTALGVQDESSWEQSYTRPVGGIVTVKSEMGEPIHKVATRGVLLWKEMDDKIFSLVDKSKRREKLRELKPYIIQRLNDDFQKVWFGRDDLGNVVDLDDMTYAEVLRRLVQLLYVPKESRWIDSSYIQLAADFVRRMYSRLLRTIPPLEANFGLHNPLLAVPEILSRCPKAEKQVISYSDGRYFLLLCKRQGQKPPTFLPDMDDDFEYWFKKDSLWQSEDLAAVVGEDAGRTCILQGPVAAKYSTRVDEPVGEILDSINRAHVAAVLKDRYGDDASQVPPELSSSTGPWNASLTPSHCLVHKQGKRAHFHIASSIESGHCPDTDQWLRALAGRPGTWLYALLTAKHVSQGFRLVANPVRRALSPALGMHVEVTEANDPEDLAMAVFHPETESTASCLSRYSMLIRKKRDILVTFYCNETAEQVTLPLTFKFTYHPDMPLHPIHEIMEGRKDRLRTFYYRLWFGPERDPRPCSPQRIRNDERRPLRPCDGSVTSLEPKPSIPSVAGDALESHRKDSTSCPDFHLNTASPGDWKFRGRGLTISSSAIEAFRNGIEPAHNAMSSWADRNTAPLDFAIVVAWEAMMKAILPSAIDGDLLNLVHLSNKFRVLNDGAPLCDGDDTDTTAHVVAIRNEAPGRVVEVGAIVERRGTPVVELVSEFLFRGSYTDFGVCFEKKTEPKMCISLDSPAKIAVLASKEWIRFVEPKMDLLGLTIIFELKSLNRLGPDSGYRSVQTIGQVYSEHAVTKSRHVVATVNCQCGKTANNPVMDYLKRHASPVDVLHGLNHPQPLGERGWLRLTMPATNDAYARASRDLNPIHTSRPLAKYADLPGTITHGMFTSAAVRQLVEKAAGASEKVRMRSYRASFVDMVLPGDVLEVSVSHVAMKNGLRVLSFEAVNASTGDKVLVGEAEVDQLLSAYVFTGQGSQTPGMGMDLCATCHVARGVWDAADKFYSETYGFRISDIVKHNPKQLTIYFGGRRGRKVRQNYMDMTVECHGQSQPLFKSITPTTAKHTFQHSAGLLFSTEFAQPALSVLGHAQFLHLKAKGLVDPSALFAGHSLGEYTALSTIGSIMPFEKVLSVVFYRGLTMQSAVARDAHGRSNFSLMAVDPGRVSRSMATESLQALVAAVAATTGGLLEVVNYNVAGQQYVVAGTLASLDCLTHVANHMASHPADFEANYAANIQNLVAACAAQATKKPLPIRLERGIATIPLEGIDVPFHSSFLLSMMPAFRRVLQRYITPEAIDARRLVDKYVSNVTGKTFDISYGAVQEAYERTGSEVLRDLLKELEESHG